MSLATLLDKIATKHKRRQQTRLSDYRDLVGAIADGNEPDEETTARLLHDTDKPIEQLRHDVELLGRRRALRATMDKAQAISVEKPSIDKQIEAAGKVLEAAQEKHDEDVAPFYVRLSEIKQAQKAGDAAKQELMATCENEELLAELDDVTNRHKAATGRRFEMTQDRNQLRRWADRNLHEATLTQWPHVVEKYREEAQHQHAQADDLDKQLADLEKTIAKLDKREYDLLQRLLVP